MSLRAKRSNLGGGVEGRRGVGARHAVPLCVYMLTAADAFYTLALGRTSFLGLIALTHPAQTSSTKTILNK